MSNTRIESDRLILVPISLDHGDVIFQEFTAEITTYMYPTPPKTPRDTEEFIESSQKKIEAGSDLVMAILNKKTQEFLGCVGLHKLDRDTKDPELGIWVKKIAHGNAYGREAVTAVKKWADENTNYEYIHYPVSKLNIPSRKIVESLGGKVVRELTKENQRGTILDEVEYLIYRPER